METVPRLVKVKDHDNLIKDTYSKAVLNIDPQALTRHETIMMKLQKEKQRDMEIISLRTELEDLKNLLKELLNKR